MIYDVSLPLVAIVLGVLYLAGHLPGLLQPRRFYDFLRPLPRNQLLGSLLVALAASWFCGLTATQDLGELSPFRWQLTGTWAIGAALLIIFVPNYLTVRGLAMLMLLAVYIMLDACFLVDSPWRLVVTVLAYVWAVVAIVLVASPYLLRDLLDFCCHDRQRCRLFSAAGSVFGLLLISLGVFVYPYVH
ncbi:MAG: hypothetical protein AAGK14_00765 [Verrucomicrobiota bacterium]